TTHRKRGWLAAKPSIEILPRKMESAACFANPMLKRQDLLGPACVADDNGGDKPQESLFAELRDPAVRRLRAGEESEEMGGAADVPGGEAGGGGVAITAVVPSVGPSLC